MDQKEQESNLKLSLPTWDDRAMGQQSADMRSTPSSATNPVGDLG